MKVSNQQCAAFNALPDDLKYQLGSIAGAAAFHDIVGDFLIHLATLIRRQRSLEVRRAKRRQHKAGA